jgi:uncharacterized protein YkwD
MKWSQRLVVLLVVAVAACAVFTAPVQAQTRAQIEGALLQLINHTRAQHGLHAVRLQCKLDAAALHHSRQMLACDYFSHYSAGGASFDQRLREAGYGCSGYRDWSVGEVIGWGTGPAACSTVFRGWLHSPAHRHIILLPRWRDVGVGCARGCLKGRDGTLMCTVDFGRRDP